jgi:hypothetical protein
MMGMLVPETWWVNKLHILSHLVGSVPYIMFTMHGHMYIKYEFQLSFHIIRNNVSSSIDVTLPSCHELTTLTYFSLIFFIFIFFEWKHRTVCSVLWDRLSTFAFPWCLDSEVKFSWKAVVQYTADGWKGSVRCAFSALSVPREVT